jgi:hypothetical protein
MRLVNKDSCPHARVLIHDASSLFHTRIEYADALDIPAIDDGAYDGQNSFRAQLKIPPPVFPYDLVCPGLTQRRPLA